MSKPIQREISLREALCGFSFKLQHLDGRVLLLKSAPGEIIRPGDQKAIPSEGMPHYKRSIDKGQLIISVRYRSRALLALSLSLSH